jgi:uncharacterized membrane protein (UPF0127 family)
MSINIRSLRHLVVPGLFLVLFASILWCYFNHFAVIQTRNGYRIYHIDLADTPAERAKGLMFRRSLPQRYGMLFVFPNERPRQFWMKNTFVPLDIAFFDRAGNIVNFHRAEPCHSIPCPVYASSGPARWVLETNPGHADDFEKLLFYY